MEAASFSGRIAPGRINALGVKERMTRGTQQVDARGASAFLELAEGLGLGVAARDKIELKDVSLG